MSYSPNLSSAFNDTRMRSGQTSFSGMCSLCSEHCVGTCEIGLSAMRGEIAVYPTNSGDNQVASEKIMPVDYSHFNINGRVFGAAGIEADADQATIFNVKLERTIGRLHPVRVAMPVVLPAVIKLDWKDYFAGAAMAGVICVIGENALGKFKDVEYRDGKVVRFESLKEIFDSFRRYDRGYGQIVLQCNWEDNARGLPEYAIREAKADAIEFKFGQSAKGTQPAVRIRTLEEALKQQENGAIVYPDPSDPKIQEAYGKKACPNFFSYSRLPMWTEEYLKERIEELRAMGLKNVYFKMAGFDRADMERVLRIAASCHVDMVTFDGAGGGSGYSPCKMMNEWGYPAILIEAALAPVCRQMEAEGLMLPDLAIAGGFTMEDHVYKALALGAPYVKAVGLCRAPMAAAMNGKKIGELLEEGNLPPHIQKYGSTKEEIFADLSELRWLYGERADQFAAGAIGVYSYLKRIAFGLQHFAALNRKFDVSMIDASDLIPLTREAKEILGGTWFSR